MYIACNGLVHGTLVHQLVHQPMGPWSINCHAHPSSPLRTGAATTCPRGFGGSILRACVECPAGTYGDGTLTPTQPCIACPGNSVSVRPGQRSCKRCRLQRVANVQKNMCLPTKRGAGERPWPPKCTFGDVRARSLRTRSGAPYGAPE